MFNFFNTIFGCTPAQPHHSKHSGGNNQPSTLLPQLVKGAYVLGGIASMVQVLSHFTSGQSSNDTSLNDMGNTTGFSTATTMTDGLINPIDLASTSVCTLALLAVSTGQTVIQLAGALLANSCIRPSGVSATFLTTTGLSGNEYGIAGLQTLEGNNIVLGATDSVGVGNYDAAVTGYGANGTLVWSSTVGSAGNELPTSMAQSPNGNIVFTGVTNLRVGNNDLLIATVYPNGTSIVVQTIAGSCATLIGTSIQAPQDNVSIIGGYTSCYGAGGVDFLLANITSTGAWFRTWGGSNDEIGFSIDTSDNETAVGGYTKSFGAGGQDVFVTIADLFGNFFRSITLGGAFDDEALLIKKSKKTGRYVFIGDTASFGAGSTDLLIGLLNPDLTPRRILAIGGANADYGAAFDFIDDDDDGIIAIGNTMSFGAGGKDVFLLRCDADLNLLWSKTWGGSADDIGYFVRRTKNKKFIAGGSTSSKGAGNQDIFFAEFDKHGQILHCNETFRTVYPTVTDITHLVTVTYPTPTVTSPTPTITTWPVSAVAQHLNQDVLCSSYTSTASKSNAKSQTVSSSQSLNQSHSFSQSNSFISSATETKTPSNSAYSATPTQLQSATSSKSISLSQTSSGLFQSRSQSLIDSSSHSRQHLKTPTHAHTKTRPIKLSTSVLIQEFNLPLTGITQTQLSVSGSLVLTQTATGVQLVKVSAEGTMTPAGEIGISGNLKAMAFSKDERYLFVANDQGKVEVMDIQNPEHPQLKGFVSVNGSIQSLATSGSGDQLLVGTPTGVEVLSAKTPANIETLTVISSYNTTAPVQSIQTNPNTNVVAVGSGTTLTLLDLNNGQLTPLNQTKFSSPILTIFHTDLANPTTLTLKLNNGDTVVMDVSNPKSASITSTIFGAPQSLTALSGSTLLVAGAKPGIQIFDNTQKNWGEAPESGYTPVLGPVTSLSFSSDGKFGIYSDGEGLKLIKIIQNPGRLDVPLPRQLEVVSLGFPIYQVLLNEESNWIAIGGDRLVFISGDNLQHPHVLSTLNINGNVKRMVFFPDKTKLLLVDNGGIAYVNCFNPEAPQILGRWNSVNPIYGVTLNGAYAYVCQGEIGISVLDLTNPLHIVTNTTLSTEGSAQSILFNRARSAAYVADGSGVDIWSLLTPLNPQRISRFSSTGHISTLALSHDENVLYFANEAILGQINVTDLSMPKLSGRLDAPRPIKDIVLSHEGKVAYLADETAGLLVINTTSMQIKGQLLSTSANSGVLYPDENQILIADSQGGLNVVELISELPIIPLTARTNYPVGVQVQETLLFYNSTLNLIAIDRINRIQYINNGQKESLPAWISADLEQRKLFITAPKELTDQIIQLAISVEVNGVLQDTIYQTQVSSSLRIIADRGFVNLATPSPTVSVNVNLTQAAFMPQPTGILSVSIQGNMLQAFGPVGDMNSYLQSIRINPLPITLDPSVIALNLARITAADLTNAGPSEAEVVLRNSFRFNQPPVVRHLINATTIKALNNVVFNVPSDTFADPDDVTLLLSAQLLNGTALPSWFKFDPMTATFSVNAPVSMLNQTLQIQITVRDPAGLSANTTWLLHIDEDHGIVLVKQPQSITRQTSAEFTYNLPEGMFQDLNNNSMIFDAVEKGYPVLPGYLTFNSDTNSLLGRPTPDDVGVKTIVIRASDEYGACAETTFDVKIEFSRADAIQYVLDKCALVAQILAPFTFMGGMYYKRSAFYNMLKGKLHFRNEVPAALLQGKSYKPKHPQTEQEIEKEDITEIRVMVMEEKCGYQFAQNILPIFWFAQFYAKPLMNKKLLPKWVVLDLETVSIELKSNLFPHENDTYLFQVIGKYKYFGEEVVLESFLVTPNDIQPIDISMHHVPTRLVDLITAVDFDEIFNNISGSTDSKESANKPSNTDSSTSKQSANHAAATEQSETAIDIWSGLEESLLPKTDDKNVKSKSPSPVKTSVMSPSALASIDEVENDDNNHDQSLEETSTKKQDGCSAKFFNHPQCFESPQTKELRETFAGKSSRFQSHRLGSL